MVPILENKLFFLVNSMQGAPASISGWKDFSADNDFVYYPFCHDFGPFGLASIFRFCSKLDRILSSCGSDPVLFYTTGDPKMVSNCAFLLAAFLVMHGHTAVEACRLLEGAGTLLGFCDVSHGPGTPVSFTLSVYDCAAGLARARDAGLVSFAGGPGCFDVDEYELLDDPNNGDVHVVVPGRFIAFRGPCEDAVCAAGPWADRGGARDFHPSFYADMFCDMDVRLVIRLNSPRYDAGHFARAGLPVRELCFDDCTAPPLGVVFRFFRAADEEAGGGAVAVHCRAGLGRTGTLIALWLMKTHRFTAREAIGWLRVVRPGSVIGPQQQYLVDMQAKMWQWGALPQHKQAELVRNGCRMTAAAGAGDDPSDARADGCSDPRAAPSPAQAQAEAAAAMGDAVAAGAERRAARRWSLASESSAASQE